MSGTKQDIQDTKTEFTQSLATLYGSTDQKFEDINSHLINIKYDLTKSVKDVINDNLSKV